MIFRSNMDRLVGALMLNRSFREAFVFNRLGAIAEYNQQQMLQLRRPLELNNEELRLVLLLLPSSSSSANFIQALEEYIVKEGLALF